ncbi:hypothetical protein GCM10027592_05610 [Spirosoma flavus]
MKYRKEIMSREFTKHLLDFRGKNSSLHLVIHHFKGPDKGGPHDHPFRFRTHILKGSYIERVYSYTSDGQWRFEDIERKAGTTHLVEAECIHELIHLPEGDCWTVIQPEQKVREPGFWRFEEGGIWFRQWNSKWKRVY